MSKKNTNSASFRIGVVLEFTSTFREKGEKEGDEHVDQKFAKDVLGFMEKWHLPAWYVSSKKGPWRTEELIFFLTVGHQLLFSWTYEVHKQCLNTYERLHVLSYVSIIHSEQVSIYSTSILIFFWSMLVKKSQACPVLKGWKTSGICLEVRLKTT